MARLPGTSAAASPASAAPESHTHTGNGVLVVEAGLSSVTATVVDLAGTALPVALSPYDSDGRYAGTVTFSGPGVWTVRFSSAHPPVTVGHAEIVGDQNLLAALFASPKAA